MVAGAWADEGKFLEDRELTKKELKILEQANEKGIKRTSGLSLYGFTYYFFKDISLEMRELLIDEGIKLRDRWDVHNL